MSLSKRLFFLLPGNPERGVSKSRCGRGFQPWTYIKVRARLRVIVVTETLEVWVRPSTSFLFHKVSHISSKYNNDRNRETLERLQHALKKGLICQRGYFYSWITWWRFVILPSFSVLLYSVPLLVCITFLETGGDYCLPGKSSQGLPGLPEYLIQCHRYLLFTFMAHLITLFILCFMQMALF